MTGGQVSQHEIGLDGSHGRSPGGTGRLFPDVTLPTVEGGILALDNYRPRWDLIVFMLGEGIMSPMAATLLSQLAAVHADLEVEHARVVAIVADAPSRWWRGWNYPFPLAFDSDGQVHNRVGALDRGGRPAAGVYVTDRYREIFAVLRPGDADWPQSAEDVMEWLTFVNIQCPECNSPE